MKETDTSLPVKLNIPSIISVMLKCNDSSYPEAKFKTESHVSKNAGQGKRKCTIA